MIMQSPTLVDICRQVQFSAENESIYDVVRKEPEKHCVSSLEACALSLTLLEPNQDSAIEAKTFLEGSMMCMVERKMQVSQLEEPRFARPGAKIFERNKRRHEIKKQLFSKE